MSTSPSKIAVVTAPGRAGWKSWLLALLVAGAGGLLAVLSNLALTDPMGKATDKAWGTAGMAAAASMLAAGLAAMVRWLTHADWASRAGRIGSLFALAASLTMAGLGLRLVGAADERGGDWHAVAVGAAWVFGVFYPTLHALLCIALWARLRR